LAALFPHLYINIGFGRTESNDGFFKLILGISGEDALNDYEATFAPDGHIRTALTLQEDEAQKQVKGLNFILRTCYMDHDMDTI